MNTLPQGTRIRFSKKLFAQLDPNVVKAFHAIQARWPSIKSFRYEQKPEGYQFIVGEGERYTFVFGAAMASVDVVSNDTVGAANVSHAIGSVVQPKAGTVVFCVVPMGDKRFLTVTNITEKTFCCSKCNKPVNLETDKLYLSYANMPLMCNRCALLWTCSDCGEPLGYEGKEGELCDACEREKEGDLHEDHEDDWDQDTDFSDMIGIYRGHRDDDL